MASACMGDIAILENTRFFPGEATDKLTPCAAEAERMLETLELLPAPPATA